MLEVRLISSLEPVRSVPTLSAPVWDHATALSGERFHFQLAYRFTAKDNRVAAAVDIEMPHIEALTVYTVSDVPVHNPSFAEHPDNLLTDGPALLPDPLLPFDGHVTYKAGYWSSLWCEADTAHLPAGEYPIRFILRDENDPSVTVADVTFTLTVLSAVLPPQTLVYTDWLHLDCLAKAYDTPVFSERHWELIDRYMANEAAAGVNMIYVPLFTPPLDTKVGAERPTVQLIGVTLTENGYAYDFSRLARYLDLAVKNGMRYFEMSHLFTQWGAGHAPKIVTEDGKRLFGWDTDADDPMFVAFLQDCLAALKAFLIARGEWDRCWFHLSDEPQSEHKASYERAYAAVEPVLHDANRMDALSDYAFYRTGLVPRPVVILDRVEEFRTQGVKPLWAYYCCLPAERYSNRLIAMPPCRNRILGWQLFCYGISGFLHWGYNFWFSVLSRHAVNPFLSTDADGGFPAGDAFTVYPGTDGYPVPSLRQQVFFDALQDQRALQLLEQKEGHAAAMAFVERYFGDLTLTAFPQDPSVILTAREALNRRLAAGK